jgi:hypothetical protein
MLFLSNDLLYYNALRSEMNQCAVKLCLLARVESTTQHEGEKFSATSITSTPFMSVHLIDFVSREKCDTTRAGPKPRRQADLALLYEPLRLVEKLHIIHTSAVSSLQSMYRDLPLTSRLIEFQVFSRVHLPFSSGCRLHT